MKQVDDETHGHSHHHHHHHHHHPDHRKKLTSFLFKNKKAAASLLITYILGYLSATFSIHTTTTTSSGGGSSSSSSSDHLIFSSRCATPPVPSNQVRETILNHIFNDTSPYENFPPPHTTPLLRWKRIKGWGSNGAVFENLIRRVRPNTIIEVGTFLGASAIHMTHLTHKLNLTTQILCLDDFRGWPGFRQRFSDIAMVNADVMLLYQFIQNLVHENATHSVLPLPFSTASSLEKLCELGIRGDLIEVDAGHDFQSAWSDINRAYKLLRPGGVIFGHDYFTSADNRGVRRAVNLFSQLKALPIHVDGQHWVIYSP